MVLSQRLAQVLVYGEIGEVASHAFYPILALIIP